MVETLELYHKLMEEELKNCHEKLVESLVFLAKTLGDHLVDLVQMSGQVCPVCRLEEYPISYAERLGEYLALLVTLLTRLLLLVFHMKSKKMRMTYLQMLTKNSIVIKLS